MIQSEEWTRSIFASLGKKSSVFRVHRASETAQPGLIEGDFFFSAELLTAESLENRKTKLGDLLLSVWYWR